MTLQIELESLKKETDVFSTERREKVEEDLDRKRTEAKELTRVWEAGAFISNFTKWLTFMTIRRTCPAAEDQGCESEIGRRKISTRGRATTRTI